MCLMNVSSSIKAGGVYPLLMQSAIVPWTLKEIWQFILAADLLYREYLYTLS